MIPGPRPVLAMELGLLGVLALLWGSSYLFVKLAVSDIPPVTLIAVRVSVAAAMLAAIALAQGHRFPRDGRCWRMLLVQAFFNSIGAWTLLAWGQQFVDSGVASVLNSTSPIFVFLLTLVLTRHESVGAMKLVGAVLGLVGVVLIIGVDALAGLGREVMGQLAVLAGAVLYAGAAIYGRRLSHLPAPITAAGTMIVATACLVPASLIVEQPWTLDPSWRALGATAVLSVFCTGLALLIYFRLLRTLGSMGTASQSYLRAGVGAMLGVVVLGEPLTVVMAVGLIAAILGVAAINLPVRGK